MEKFLAVLLLIGLFQGMSSKPDDWWKYPPPFDALKLALYQARMQASNLIDSYPKDTNMPRPCHDPVLGGCGHAPTVCPVKENKYRTVDGTCNDLTNPAAGSRFYRFGRNIPLNETVSDKKKMYTPNPREVSQKLLKRDKFIPATTINMLVPAWIQFMVHDWFDHGKNEESKPFKVPPYSRRGRVMKILRSRPDSCKNKHPFSNKSCNSSRYSNAKKGQNEEDAKGDTFQNTVTHWWDGSQLYGSDTATSERVRAFKNGKLYVAENGRLPVDRKTGLPITGNNNNWWIGLGLMHNLWTLEHNYICDELIALNPSWDDEQIFQTARLIVTAVIAKIHTLEWTTAILNNKIAILGLKSNWYGLKLSEFVGGNKSLEAMLAKRYPQFAKGVPGAIGNKPNNRGVPYSLTEEFVSVYRLHPLLPEKIAIKDEMTGEVVNEYDFPDVSFGKAEAVMEDNSMENLFYTFGHDYPGAMTLHNYPKWLTNLKLPKFSPDGKGRVDVATIDILRDRERGIPRYNQFRRLIYLSPISSFEELANNDTTIVDQLRQVYNNDVEQIDLLVGSLAEAPLPSGFGFSDTFFRIFVIMARRRLEADRFFTDDYTAEFYTQWGLDYIDSTWMKEILIRHYPQLTYALDDVKNVFMPWNINHH